MDEDDDTYIHLNDNAGMEKYWESFEAYKMRYSSITIN